MGRKNFDRLVCNYRTLEYWADLPCWVENGKYTENSDGTNPLKQYVSALDKLIEGGTVDKKILESLRKDLQWLRLEFMEFELGEAMPEPELAELKEMRKPMFSTLEEWETAINKCCEDLVKTKKGGATQ